MFKRVVPEGKAQPIQDDQGYHDQVIAVPFENIRALALLPEEVTIIETLKRGGAKDPWCPDGSFYELYDHTTLFLRITSKYAVVRPRFGMLCIETLEEFMKRYPPVPTHV
jgi:hypothetical protein